MEATLASRLQEIIEQLVQYQNAQDLPGILRLMHPQSFAYGPSEQLMMRLFATYELKFSLLAQTCLATDDEFVYMKTTIKSEKLAGPEFKDNITESLVVCRCIDGEWKIWCQAPLQFVLL